MEWAPRIYVRQYKYLKITTTGLHYYNMQRPSPEHSRFTPAPSRNTLFHQKYLLAVNSRLMIILNMSVVWVSFKYFLSARKCNFSF